MSSDNGEQKPTLPTKSSMEILSELFSTFHAEPPLIIKKEKSEESNKKHKKSKKKHKHKEKKHKKKEKKKRKSSSSSSDESEVDLSKILIKQEKGSSEKKIKIEGTELAWDVKLKDLKKEKYMDDGLRDATKNESSCSKEKSKLKLNPIVLESTTKEGGSKIKKKANEDGEISDSESSISDKDVKKHKRHKHKSSSKKRSPSSGRDKPEKKLKVDDLRYKIKTEHKYTKRSCERNHSKEKERRRDHSVDKDFSKSSYHSRSSDGHRSRERDRTRDRQRDHRSRSRERHKDTYSKEIEDYKRSRNRDTSFYRDDGFYKSKEREERDEKPREK